MGRDALVKPRRFKRLDNVEGVGFYIQWGGLTQASVAWPDGPSTRHVPDDFDRNVIVDLGEVNVCDARCVTVEETGILEQLLNGDVVVDGVVIQQSAGSEIRLGETLEPARDPENGSLEPELAQSPSLEVTPGPLAEDISAPPAVNPTIAIADYLDANPGVAIQQVVDHLETNDITVTAAKVASVRDQLREADNAAEEEFASESITEQIQESSEQTTTASEQIQEAQSEEQAAEEPAPAE